MGSREGWLLIRTPAGEVGWLSSTGVTINDGRNQAVRYRVSPGKWELEAESSLKIVVARLSTGVMQMTLTGLNAVPKLQQLQDGSVLLTGANIGDLKAAIDIGDSKMERLSVSEKGIMVELADRPINRVVQIDEQRVVLEFRPGLERLQRTTSGWSFYTRGDLRPTIRQEGNDLVMDLPGANLADDFPGLPEGVNLAEVEPEPSPAGAPQPSSLTATVPTRMTAGGLRLRLPAPSAPYALYRTGPGILELRELHPGLSGKTIILDPGHGGGETGAVGPNGTIEKDINLALALLIKPMLEQQGSRVIMTRTGDTRVIPSSVADSLKSESERTSADLAARSTLANREKADLYLSIHANGGPPSDGGAETYWALSNLNASRSLFLAEKIQSELVEALGLTNRGVKQRAFNVIRYSEAPAVLVELGFMTNTYEERLLASADGQRMAAEALLRGIQAYYGER